MAAGPAARRLARELKVDLVRIRGTGSGGRITPEDVQAFRGPRACRADRRRAPAPAAEDERWGPVERRALTGIEKAAARHLSASWSEIPHVTHHDLADVTELEEARRRYEAGKDKAEPKLTWTALVVAVVVGLRAYPRVNSSLDLEREELVTKRYVHVGVAVDTEHGLLVPVLRDADRKTTREIAAEIATLAERARARKLALQDMQGASFTVTNVGGIGGVAFTPIVSRPEVAILGVARTREELALRAGQVTQRIVLPLSLSYDHRVINGADAARFVRYVAELLEDPLHLLLESWRHGAREAGRHRRGARRLRGRLPGRGLGVEVTLVDAEAQLGASASSAAASHPRRCSTPRASSAMRGRPSGSVCASPRPRSTSSGCAPGRARSWTGSPRAWP